VELLLLLLLVVVGERDGSEENNRIEKDARKKQQVTAYCVRWHFANIAVSQSLFLSLPLSVLRFWAFSASSSSSS
jgi:hypothetical protein